MDTKKEPTISCAELRPGTESQPKAFAANSQIPQLEAWPTQPKQLVMSKQETMLWALYDLALIALPILLIIKTILCCYAARLDKDNTGIAIDRATLLSRTLVQLNEQLVTLFTVVFITIISTFVKRLALWKAQGGARLADLEQLQGSVSLPSTIKLVWSLRSFGVTSALLVFVWSFYYLGSQAVKLEYLMTDSGSFKHHEAAVQKSDAPSIFSPYLASVLQGSRYTMQDIKYQGGLLSLLNLRLAGTLLSTDDHSKGPFLGTNDGPLVPFYPTTDSTVAPIDDLVPKAGGWVDVSHRSRNYVYTSYVGLPLYYKTMYSDEMRPTQVLGSYTLTNTSYLNVTCGPPKILAYDTFPNGTSYNSSVNFNMSEVGPDSPRDANRHILRQFSYWWRGDLGSSGYNTALTPRAVQSMCNLTTVYIDVQVYCLPSGCYPSRMRWSNNTSQELATSYHTPFADDTFAADFFGNMTLSTGPQDLINSSTLVGYFFPDCTWLNSTLGTYCESAGVSLCEDPGVRSDIRYYFDEHLITIFNTYYMLSQSVISNFFDPKTATIMVHGSDQFFKIVHLYGAEYLQQYRIYWQWVPVDLVACLILLTAAIASCWLRVNTLAPDIFGFVSSLTRDNPNIELPLQGSTLSGIERARMLKDFKVKIGDMHERSESGEAHIGRISLVSAVHSVHHLERHRAYL